MISVMSHMSSSTTTPAPVTIRQAVPADGPALARLASLDSARALRGTVLIAERGTRLMAAIAVDSGRFIADPFSRTSDLVSLLELRAEGVRRASGRRTRGPGLLLRRRAALAG
jgi:hypothetical protein